MSSYSIKPLEREQRPLSGQRILLTRAGEDNNKLAHALRKLGAVTLISPCLQIETTDNPEQWQKRLNAIEKADGIVFTSRYAVRAIQNHWPQALLSTKYYAIGPATATEMEAAGLPAPVVALPHSSEGLLTHPNLQSIADQSWLIIGGEEPRMYLQENLQERGAKPEFIACYKRSCPYYSSNSIQRLNDEGLTTVVVQSMGCLKNLALLLSKFPNHALWKAMLIVPTERSQTVATELGFCDKVIVVGATTDEAIITALLESPKGIADE